MDADKSKRMVACTVVITIRVYLRARSRFISTSQNDSPLRGLVPDLLATQNEWYSQSHDGDENPGLCAEGIHEACLCPPFDAVKKSERHDVLRGLSAFVFCSR